MNLEHFLWKVNGIDKKNHIKFGRFVEELYLCIVLIIKLNRNTRLQLRGVWDNHPKAYDFIS